jgi:hypothetical protein
LQLELAQGGEAFMSPPTVDAPLAVLLAGADPGDAKAAGMPGEKWQYRFPARARPSLRRPAAPQRSI